MGGPGSEPHGEPKGRHSESNGSLMNDPWKIHGNHMEDPRGTHGRSEGEIKTHGDPMSRGQPALLTLGDRVGNSWEHCRPMEVH